MGSGGMRVAFICVLVVAAGAITTASVASAQLPDVDGDGFPAPPDLCPNQAGVQQFFGCPSDDSDGDGVGLSVPPTDACPEVPGPNNGCPEQQPEPKPPAEAEDVGARRMSLDPRGGLSLYGQPFDPRPRAEFAPKTLTVWLPKGISLLGGKVKACSKRQARNLLHDMHRCTRFAAGRFSSDDARGWYAFAGPKQGEKRLVWLRTLNHDEEGDPYLDRFGTGVIEQASGAYGAKLVLRFGELAIRTRLVEVDIAALRTVRPCPSGGWPFKVTTAAAEGNGSALWRAACGAGK